MLRKFTIIILYMFANRNNALTCKDGYFYQNGSCVPCIANCKTCQSDSSCSKCMENYYLSSSHYAKQCQICYWNCKYCTGPNDNQCEECYDNAYLKNGKCLAKQTENNNTSLSVILIIIGVVLFGAVLLGIIYNICKAIRRRRLGNKFEIEMREQKRKKVKISMGTPFDLDEIEMGQIIVSQEFGKSISYNKNFQSMKSGEVENVWLKSFNYNKELKI